MSILAIHHVPLGNERVRLHRGAESDSGPLSLRNEPARSRLVLSPGSTVEGIPLDYRRMGFTRLVDRVRIYGRFPTPDSARPTT